MHLVTWPNIISLLRLPLAAAFLLAATPVYRAVIVAAAAASDWLDGWIARRFDRASRVGEILDPVTDRLFVAVALATFALEGQIALWELALLLLRDVYNVLAGGLVFLLRWPVRLRARRSGKLVTAVQFAAVLLLLARPDLSPALAVAAGIAGAIAIVDYTRTGIGALRRADSAV
jgi:phosphatidylglycerophosphate synthase